MSGKSKMTRVTLYGRSLALVIEHQTKFKERTGGFIGKPESVIWLLEERAQIKDIEAETEKLKAELELLKKERRLFSSKYYRPEE